MLLTINTTTLEDELNELRPAVLNYSGINTSSSRQVFKQHHSHDAASTALDIIKQVCI